VKKLTGVVLSDRKDIMTHVVASCLEEIERSKVYLIHASKEDFPDLQEKKEELEEKVGEEAEIKIVEDASLGKNQCLIESDTSIYDSSLDLQLERLCEDLKILSLHVEKE
jgi:flagellar assembly protein FliH